MITHYKYFTLAVGVFLFTFFALKNTAPIFAVTCTGVTNNFCSSVDNYCEKNFPFIFPKQGCDPNPYQHCFDGSGNCPCGTPNNNTAVYRCASLGIQNYSGFTCDTKGGTKQCGGCVPANQLCQTGGAPFYDENGIGQWYPVAQCTDGIWDGSQVSCGNVSARNCTFGCTTIPDCTQGTQPGSCFYTSNPYGAPANTCYTNNGRRNEQCTHDQVQTCDPQPYGFTVNWTINNCNQNAGYTCSGQNCITDIHIHVYTDYDHDGAGGTADINYTGQLARISDSGGNNPTTDANGDVTFTGKTTGTYTIVLTPPTGWQAVGASSQQVVLDNSNGNKYINFYITPLYAISGTVFSDKDQSHCYNPASHDCTDGLHVYSPGIDDIYTTGRIKVSGNTTGTINTTANASGSVDANGNNYATTQILPSGQYTVDYDTGVTPLPSGYKLTTPQSYTVTVGNIAGTPTCNIGTSADTRNTECTNPNNGSISQLNFGLIDENTWPQACGDTRIDNGYSETIPATADCGGTSAPYAIMTGNYCPATPGILFSGGTNPSYGQGSGASTTGLQVGNANFSEYFTPHTPNAIESSYNFVMNSTNNLSTPPTPLTTLCPNSSAGNPCMLSAITPGGVYTSTAADGTFYLAASGPLGSTNYTFVVGGDLYIESNISQPAGYSTAFISGNNIHIAGAVGETNWNSVTPDIEGFFSADKNFYLDRVDSTAATCNTDGSPIDRKLNILGSVTTNAGGTGGSIVNNREGCLQDYYCPTMTFPVNPQQILHLPSVLRIPLTFWQELNP